MAGCGGLTGGGGLYLYVCLGGSETCIIPISDYPHYDGQWTNPPLHYCTHHAGDVARVLAAEELTQG